MVYEFNLITSKGDIMSKRVTRWIKSDVVIDSGYGMVTGQEWCKLELDRMQAKGDTKVFVRQQGNKLALSR